jgi:predicted CoA-binding protein
MTCRVNEIGSLHGPLRGKDPAALIRINSLCHRLRESGSGNQGTPQATPMSVRNLEKLFKPRSIALIGATPRPGSVGAVVARNLHRAGFTGELMLVNPHHQTIDGLPVHPDVASLPHAPDLAVITTPQETVPRLIVSSASVGRNFPDPYKSRKTGRIIDSALKFDPVTLDKAM